MNVYISKELKEKWPNYEFLGKPIKLRDGKTYIRALSKTFNNNTHFYCFEDDFFWHDKPPIMSQ